MKGARLRQWGREEQRRTQITICDSLRKYAKKQGRNVSEGIRNCLIFHQKHFKKKETSNEKEVRKI